MSEAEFNNWLKKAVKENGEKIKESTGFVSIFTTNYEKEPLCALQIGLAVLLDTPIIIIADHKQTIPLHITKIARLIERVDINNPSDMGRASKAIERVVATL